MTMKTRLKTETSPRGLRSPLRLLAVLACLILLTTSAIPETRKPPQPVKTALIFGTVWGPDDRPVPGVSVNIRRANEKKARWHARSNRRGEFEQELPAGKQDYVIRADVKNLKSPDGKHLHAGPEVTVHIESNERADTGLHLQ
jgi:hypothetical protein